VGPGLPPRALGAIRDTARAVWELSGATPAQRALAAYVVASAASESGDRAQCARWAERAVETAPANAGYLYLLTSCRSDPE
jgi:hypothetical protein